MRIDGVSRETVPHLFCYIRRYYSHFLVIPLMILTNNNHDQMTADSNDYLLRIFAIELISHLIYLM